MRSYTAEDEGFMRRALRLARRGEGAVEPNPMVGCVLVRNGRVVGEGWHQRYGGPHAEPNALRAAGQLAGGATAYVTLEPCCHYGKTPPCTEALIAAGVVRVVLAVRDPFPKVRGRGLRQLRAAGIRVDAGLCEAEARQVLAPYLKRQASGRPWVILKWAQSLDGRIATHTGDSQWISSEASRRQVHQLRGRVDAVIVGVGTALRDDPELTCRVGRPRRIATRVVLDPRGRLSMNRRLVRTARQVPTLVVVGPERSLKNYMARMRNAGVDVLAISMLKRTTPTGRGGSGRAGLDLGALLDEFGRRGMSNVLIEGGGATHGAFLDAGLADEVYAYIAPLLIGGTQAVGAVGGAGVAKVRHAHRFEQIAIRRSGADVLVHLRRS